MKYLVGGLGWEVRSPGIGRQFLPAGTLIDDSLPQWAFLVGQGPPIDGVAMDQTTYNFMVSNGVIGLGYPHYRVAYGAGVTPV
jgi:hypothetical protein